MQGRGKRDSKKEKTEESGEEEVNIKVRQQQEKECMQN